jgi:hypothetical protein
VSFIARIRRAKPEPPVSDPAESPAVTYVRFSSNMQPKFHESAVATGFVPDARPYDSEHQEMILAELKALADPLYRRDA